MSKAPDLKLISTDFDGTLFAEFENPPIPSELQHLIAKLQRQGAVRRAGGYLSRTPHGWGVAEAIKYYLAGPSA
jgi:hypothetical protein